MKSVNSMDIKIKRSVLRISNLKVSAQNTVI